MTKVTVVGSANVDTVLSVTRIPAPGETVLSHHMSVSAGGKGLNQAIAAQRSGADTTLIAAVGSDSHSRVVLDALARANMVQSQIRRVAQPTGSAMIAVDAAGENSIIVLAGANGQLVSLTPDDIAHIATSRVVLCQLEVPQTVVLQAAREARLAGTTFVLNPSPVRELTREFLESVDVITVNEHEAQQLEIDSLDLPCAITTLGSRGALIRRRGFDDVVIAPRPAKVVDTTGAGDTFVGALSAEIARGVGIVEAARRAVVAASLAVEHPGAVPSIPTRSAVDRALALLPH